MSMDQLKRGDKAARGGSGRGRYDRAQETAWRTQEKGLSQGLFQLDAPTASATPNALSLHSNFPCYYEGGRLRAVGEEAKPAGADASRVVHRINTVEIDEVDEFEHVLQHDATAGGFDAGCCDDLHPFSFDRVDHNTVSNDGSGTPSDEEDGGGREIFAALAKSGAFIVRADSPELGPRPHGPHALMMPQHCYVDAAKEPDEYISVTPDNMASRTLAGSAEVARRLHLAAAPRLPFRDTILPVAASQQHHGENGAIEPTMPCPHVSATKSKFAADVALDHLASTAHLDLRDDVATANEALSLMLRLPVADATHILVKPEAADDSDDVMTIDDCIGADVLVDDGDARGELIHAPPACVDEDALVPGDDAKPLVQHGLPYVRTAPTHAGYVGSYSPVARKARIAAFLEKRKRRVWTKKVKYDVRKNFADSRMRVKGRFVKKEDEDLLHELIACV